MRAYTLLVFLSALLFTCSCEADYSGGGADGQGTPSGDPTPTTPGPPPEPPIPRDTWVITDITVNGSQSGIGPVEDPFSVAVTVYGASGTAFPDCAGELNWEIDYEDNGQSFDFSDTSSDNPYTFPVHEYNAVGGVQTVYRAMVRSTCGTAPAVTAQSPTITVDPIPPAGPTTWTIDSLTSSTYQGDAPVTPTLTATASGTASCPGGADWTVHCNILDDPSESVTSVGLSSTACTYTSPGVYAPYVTSTCDGTVAISKFLDGAAVIIVDPAAQGGDDIYSDCSDLTDYVQDGDVNVTVGPPCDSNLPGPEATPTAIITYEVADADSTEQFLLMELSNTGGSSTHGAQFRKDTNGNYYSSYYDRNLNDFIFAQRADDHSVAWSFSGTDCGCTGLSDPADGDWAGFEIVGTGAGEEVSYWDLGGTGPTCSGAGTGVCDPSQWNTRSCGPCNVATLSADQNDLLTSPGKVGLYMSKNGGSQHTEVTSFRIGSATPTAYTMSATPTPDDLAFGEGVEVSFGIAESGTCTDITIETKLDCGISGGDYTDCTSAPCTENRAAFNAAFSETCTYASAGTYTAIVTATCDTDEISSYHGFTVVGDSWDFTLSANNNTGEAPKTVTFNIDETRSGGGSCTTITRKLDCGLDGPGQNWNDCVEGSGCTNTDSGTGDAAPIPNLSCQYDQNNFDYDATVYSKCDSLTEVTHEFRTRLATPGVNNRGPCVDGTDCYCDCVEGTDRGDGYVSDACATKLVPVDTSLIDCQDYEDPNYEIGDSFQCDSGANQGLECFTKGSTGGQRDDWCGTGSCVSVSNWQAQHGIGTTPCSPLSHIGDADESFEGATQQCHNILQSDATECMQSPTGDRPASVAAGPFTFSDFEYSALDADLNYSGAAEYNTNPLDGRWDGCQTYALSVLEDGKGGSTSNRTSGRLPPNYNGTSWLSFTEMRKYSATHYAGGAKPYDKALGGAHTNIKGDRYNVDDSAGNPYFHTFLGGGHTSEGAGCGRWNPDPDVGCDSTNFNQRPSQNYEHCEPQHPFPFASFIKGFGKGLNCVDSEFSDDPGPSGPRLGIEWHTADSLKVNRYLVPNRSRWNPIRGVEGSALPHRAEDWDTTEPLEAGGAYGDLRNEWICFQFSIKDYGTDQASYYVWVNQSGPATPTSSNLVMRFENLKAAGELSPYRSKIAWLNLQANGLGQPAAQNWTTYYEVRDNAHLRRDAWPVPCEQVGWPP